LWGISRDQKWGAKIGKKWGAFLISQYIAKKIIRLRFFTFSQANYFCVSDSNECFRPI
jgi:hypothetical protein